MWTKHMGQSEVLLGHVGQHIGNSTNMLKNPLRTSPHASLPTNQPTYLVEPPSVAPTYKSCHLHSSPMIPTI